MVAFPRNFIFYPRISGTQIFGHSGLVSVMRVHALVVWDHNEQTAYKILVPQRLATLFSFDKTGASSGRCFLNWAQRASRAICFVKARFLTPSDRHSNAIWQSE
jgi:hypothetical protein